MCANKLWRLATTYTLECSDLEWSAGCTKTSNCLCWYHVLNSDEDSEKHLYTLGSDSRKCCI